MSRSPFVRRDDSETVRQRKHPPRGFHMSVRPFNAQTDDVPSGTGTMPMMAGSRLDQVIQAGHIHRQRVDAAAATGAALLPRPAAPRSKSSTNTQSIFDDLLMSKTQAVTSPEPDPESVQNRVTYSETFVSDIDKMIAAASISLQEKCAVSSAIAVSTESTPEVPPVAEAVAEATPATGEAIEERGFLWTAAAEHVQDGTLSGDESCFAYEGTWHPMPSSENSYACVVPGNVVGEPIDKIKHMETEWLPVGFSAGPKWWVQHRDGENFWVKSPDAGGA